MEKAKSIGQAISKALLPHEANILKLQDILLFFEPKRSAVFFVGLNVLLIGFACLKLSVYSVICLIMGLYSIRGLWWPRVCNLFTKFVLAKEIYNVPEGVQRRRYLIAEISAFIGTVYFVAVQNFDKAMNAVANKEIFNMASVMFALMFTFYLFLSFSDAMITVILINGILLIPYVSQTNILQMITTKITAFAKKATEMKLKKCDEEAPASEGVKEE